MVTYKLGFSDEGRISFSSLDKAVSQRILNKLKWLTKNIETISPLPLKWNYEGIEESVKSRVTTLGTEFPYE